MKKFRHYDPEQEYLLPENPRTWLPKDHLVFFLNDVVDKMDLNAITQPYEAEERGYPPYHPVMMVKVLLYAYCIAVFSSRKIMRCLHEDVAFRVISGNNQPDFRTICEFRRRHLAALEGLFTQVLHLCMEANLVRLGHVSIDGTKVKANASRHKAMSYKRMGEEMDRLRREVRSMLEEAERVDEEEDAVYGDRSGMEMPEELSDPERRREFIERAVEALGGSPAKEEEATPSDDGAPSGRDLMGEEPFGELERRAGRMERITKAKRVLEERVRQEVEEEEEDADHGPGDSGEDPGKKVSKRRKKGNRGGKKGAREPPVPKDKDQYNFTDPESRIMPDSSNRKAFIQGYNSQLVVDEANQIILASDVTENPSDRPQLPGMMDKVEEGCGKHPKRASGDAGYFSTGNLEYLESHGIDAYIPPDKTRHTHPPPKVSRGRIPKGMSVSDKMRRKLRTKKGREVYSRRKAIVEPPIGQIKHARGFRRFSMRGKDKARGEWALVCMTHNILRWFAVVGRVV